VFFNLFAAAEPYISVTITHGTTWHAIIRESNGVGKVEFSGCLHGNWCLQGSREAKACGSLGQKPSNVDDKAAGKRLVQFNRIY